MIAEDKKFGVILILPECAFSSEIDRSMIPTMMQDIDDSLTEQGAPEESSTRSEMMMENALAISSMIASQEIPSNASAYSNIAYSFLYSFGKQIGFENVTELRGLTGTYLRNRLVINPCLSEIDYQVEFAHLDKKISDHEINEDTEWDISLSLPPTKH